MLSIIPFNYTFKGKQKIIHLLKDDCYLYTNVSRDGSPVLLYKMKNSYEDNLFFNCKKELDKLLDDTVIKNYFENNNSQFQFEILNSTVYLDAEKKLFTDCKKDFIKNYLLCPYVQGFYKGSINSTLDDMNLCEKLDLFCNYAFNSLKDNKKFNFLSGLSLYTDRFKEQSEKIEFIFSALTNANIIKLNTALLFNSDLVFNKDLASGSNFYDIYNIKQELKLTTDLKKEAVFDASFESVFLCKKLHRELNEQLLDRVLAFNLIKKDNFVLNVFCDINASNHNGAYISLDMIHNLEIDAYKALKTMDLSIMNGMDKLRENCFDLTYCSLFYRVDDNDLKKIKYAKPKK